MPCRSYCWLVILSCAACASLFQRPDAFEQGYKAYTQQQYTIAVEHFEKYLTEHPTSDTTLYYLYDCYKHLGNHERSINVLERFVKLKTDDAQVYVNLITHYRNGSHYNELFGILTELPQSVTPIVDARFPVTRRFFAEMISGASTKGTYSDPMVFAATEEYIPVFPNGKFYDYDTLTNGQFVILIDRWFKPFYPERFLKMNNVPSKSHLYLPYMRLVNTGILVFNQDFNPSQYATVSFVVKAVSNLKKKGYLD